MSNMNERLKVKRENVKTFKDLILESSKIFNSKKYLSYQKDNGEIVNVSFSETAKYCEFYSSWINTNFKNKISSREIHVGVLGHGNFNYLLIYFATIYSGHVTVPIDPNSDMETLKYCVNHGDIDIIFYDKNLQPKIDYLKSSCPNVKKFILINKYQEEKKEENNNGKDGDNYSLDDILEEYKDKTYPTTVKPDDNAFIFFTSGTTGAKKGVVITNECIAEKVFSENCLEGDKDEVCLSVLPLYHVFSTSEFFYSLRLGFNVCFGQNLTKLIQYFHVFKPTIMTCVPLIAKNLVTQVLRILKEYPGISVEVARSKIFGPSFSTMIVGGSHFPESVIKDFYSIGIYRIGQGYGLTETFGNSTQPDFNPKKIASIGKLAPGFQVRFKDGEIQLKSKSVMKEYYKAPDQTREILTDDQWIRTGDLGYLDDDGYIYLTGRKKNLIILSNGENVSPEAIEQKFYDEMLIQEMIVYGKNDLLCAEVFPNYDYAKIANIPKDSVKDLIWKIIEKKNKALPSYEHIVKLTIRESPFAKTSTRKIIRQKFMEELRERERKEEIENEKEFDILKPSNDLQRRIYQCISKTLNDKEFGINANLYEYGLNSVSCTMLVHDLRHEFNIPIGLNEIINNSSVLKIEKFIRDNFSIILSKEDSSSDNTSNESDDIQQPPVSLGVNNKRKIGIYNYKIDNEPEVQIPRVSSNVNFKNSRVRVQKSLNDDDAATMDYAGEVSEIDDINISSKNLPEFKFPGKNATLFLTGATGFLGSHLLATYLDKYPEAKVYCLVRGKDKESAMKHLKKNCITYMTWKNEWEDKNSIVTICGDLSKKYFGLKKEEWKQLCEDVDIIIHSGAIVHWLYPYSQLKPTNVLSTKQCLKMASTHHLKPLYFVSSTSIFSCQKYISSMENSDEEVIIQESDDLEKYSTGIINGYGQSKWVSEKLISKAIERGVPACIIRPGFILGSEKNGMLNTDDFIIRMMIGCAQLKMAPDLSNVINTCPVDYVAGAMVQIASDEQWLKHHVYHMWNNPTISFNDIFDEMERYGYEMKRVSYDEWCSTLKYMDPSNLEKNALFPLLYFVLNGLMIKMQSPPLNDDNTREAIADSDVPDSNIKGLIGKYLAYLNKINLLAPPSEPEYSIPLPNIGEIAITATIGRNNQL